MLPGECLCKSPCFPAWVSVRVERPWRGRPPSGTSSVKSHCGKNRSDSTFENSVTRDTAAAAISRLASLLCRPNLCKILPKFSSHRFFHLSSVQLGESMLWSTSVLSTLSSDTEPSIVVSFDSAKYLFNVGENTTRSYLQSRQTWRKTRALFVTSIGTQRTSGLPGICVILSFLCGLRDYVSRSIDDICGCRAVQNTYCRPFRAVTSHGQHAEVYLPVSSSLK